MSEDNDPSQEPSLSLKLKRLWFIIVHFRSHEARTVFILIVISCIAWIAYDSMHQDLPLYDDVLVEIDRDRDDSQSLGVYIAYIVDRYRKGGMDALAEKWIEGIPPEFQTVAKERLALLGDDYRIEKTCVDKAVIYNAICKSGSNTVIIEVVKKKIGNKNVFRLQRVI